MYKFNYEPLISVCANDEILTKLYENISFFDSFTFIHKDNNNQWKVDANGIIRLKTGNPISFTKYYSKDIIGYKEGFIGLLVDNKIEHSLVYVNNTLQIQPLDKSPNFSWQLIHNDDYRFLYNNEKYLDYDEKKDSFTMSEQGTTQWKEVKIKGKKMRLKALALMYRAQTILQGEDIYKNVEACVFPRELLPVLSFNRETCYGPTDIGLRLALGGFLSKENKNSVIESGKGIYPNRGCMMSTTKKDMFVDMLNKTADNVFMNNSVMLQVLEKEKSEIGKNMIVIQKEIKKLGIELTDITNEYLRYKFEYTNLVKSNVRNRDLLKKMKENCANRKYLINKSRQSLCADISFNKPNIQYASIVDDCRDTLITSEQQWRYDTENEQVRWMGKDMGVPMCLALSRAPMNIVMPPTPLQPKLPTKNDDENKTSIELKKCENTDVQKWIYNKTTKELRSKAYNNKCVGIQGARQGQPGNDIFMSTCTGTPNQQWEFVKEQPEKYVGNCTAMVGKYNYTYNSSKPYRFLDPGSITFDKEKGVGVVQQGEQKAEFQCIETNLIRVPDMGNIEGKGDGKEIKWSNGMIWKKKERPVVLFVGCWFEGFSAELQPGRYPDPEAMGFPMNHLSSLFVPEGRKITLFDDIEFSGWRIEVTENVSCLKDRGFNDKAASAIVT